MRFLIYSLLFGLLLCQTTFAQKDLKIAEKAFKAGDYYNAVEFYESAFKDKKFEKNKAKAIESYFHYADACRFSYNFAKAEQYYKKVVERRKLNTLQQISTMLIPSSIMQSMIRPWRNLTNFWLILQIVKT